MKIIFFMLLCGPFAVQAEHRVYQLKLTDTQKNKSREFLSTLTPKQYAYYYPISAFQTLQIVDHWMCWQRSDGYKKLCTRPFSSAQSLKASSNGVSSTP